MARFGENDGEMRFPEKRGSTSRGRMSTTRIPKIWHIRHFFLLKVIRTSRPTFSRNLPIARARECPAGLAREAPAFRPAFVPRFSQLKVLHSEPYREFPKPLIHREPFEGSHNATQKTMPIASCSKLHGHVFPEDEYDIVHSIYPK